MLQKVEEMFFENKRISNEIAGCQQVSLVIFWKLISVSTTSDIDIVKHCCSGLGMVLLFISPASSGRKATVKV